MQAQAACQLIRNLIFRPGWKFHAEFWDSDLVVVTAVINTRDTNYPPFYTKGITIDPQFPVYVRDLDEDGVIYEILRNIARIDEHENREFLRRGDKPVTGDYKGGDTFEAPFHPHHPDGETRWQHQQDRQSLRELARAA